MSATYIVQSIAYSLPALVVIVVGLTLIVMRLSREPQRAYWLALVGLIVLGLMYLGSPVASYLLMTLRRSSDPAVMQWTQTAYSLISSLVRAAALGCLVAAIVMRRDRPVSPQDIPPPVVPPAPQ